MEESLPMEESFPDLTQHLLAVRNFRVKNVVCILLCNSNRVICVRERSTAAWHFPGGKVDKLTNDQLFTAMKHKFREETGLQVPSPRVLQGSLPFNVSGEGKELLTASGTTNNGAWTFVDYCLSLIHI